MVRKVRTRRRPLVPARIRRTGGLSRTGDLSRPAVLFLAAVLIAIAPRAGAQERLSLTLRSDGAWQVIERTDFRRYEAGRYVGLTSREVRGVLGADPDATPGKTEADVYRGTFLILEETRRDRQETARRISASAPSAVAITGDGSVSILERSRFPSYRNFPALPADPVAPGESWDAPGELAIDPLGTGTLTTVPFLARYEYLGRQQYQGRPVHALTARFATRYRSGGDPEGDPALLAVAGRHDVSILLSEEKETPLFIRDSLDESYRYADGELEFRGFSLVWLNLQTEVKLEETERTLRERLPEHQVPGVRVERRREGVTLTLDDLHFVADQAELLPDELPRLDAIAAALCDLEEMSFLVVGHTADVGSTESQAVLSERRAKNVVDALSERGIEPGRFLYAGRGGSVPVATNDTEQGRAENRRVEIFILEE